MPPQYHLKSIQTYIDRWAVSLISHVGERLVVQLPKKGNRERPVEGVLDQAAPCFSKCTINSFFKSDFILKHQVGALSSIVLYSHVQVL